MRITIKNNLHVLKRSLFLVLNRHLTVSETATALRPFYLAVHPDFFGQFPNERKVNEESLKKLHEYITALHKTGRADPAEVKFYVKGKRNTEFDCVEVKLLSKDVKSTVSSVLQSVSLPLNYLDTIPKDRSFPRPIKWIGPKEPFDIHISNAKDVYYKTKPQYTLLSWLHSYGAKARKWLESSRSTQEEIDKINKHLKESVGLKDIQWASNWSIKHHIGCLRSFSRLCHHHPAQVQQFLSGRYLVFSNKTGVSLHGEVVLSSEDVTTDWMVLLSSVPAYDAVLQRLPYMERKLSSLLGNIKIVRRKRREIVMAQEYELILDKILNSLRRCQNDVDRYFNGEDLSHLELVVEEDNAPLTLSATGKFLVPSSMPGILLIKYISEHKENAYMISQDMALSIEMEETIVQRCKDQLNLLSLKKEENVSSQQMIECCERLLDDKIYLESNLSHSKLRIASYYTVMYDGEMSIPWNWKSDIS